jgi:DNA ligase D-like protein (predicted ligase)
MKAIFIDPMLLLRTEQLPEGASWSYERKFDGFRALAIKTGGKVRLRSGDDNDVTDRYPAVVQALAALPDETVLDGEIVALDGAGRPSFNVLQNYASRKAAICYYVFDVLILAGKNAMTKPLSVRRDLLFERVFPEVSEAVRPVPQLISDLPSLIDHVRQERLEGLVAKRRDSRYEPGQSTGAWQTMRANRGQEFIIGGYTVGSRHFEALILGYYSGEQLLYAARTRSGFNGFFPISREKLQKRFIGLETVECPFANLPEVEDGRRSVGLTASKMKECRWLRPVLVGRFEFLEWTPNGHLRQSRFLGLREDKNPREVKREV